MTNEIYSFRLSEDLVRGIDCVSANRSLFIREAVEAKLLDVRLSEGISLNEPVEKPTLPQADGLWGVPADRRGWVCPSCSTIWSPSVRSCHCNSPEKGDW